jgi:YHS domain-containing protein
MKSASTVLVMAWLVGAAQFAVGQGQQSTDQAQEQQRRDQLRIAVQEICPISGQKLGSMGTPIKVKVGEETVFLCCQGCLQQKIKPEHWSTIHANAAKAQRICPVMKHEISKNPKWTIVEGQVVYVCCPPCKKKIAADPQKYLRAVDALYSASLDARKRVR